MSIPLILNNSAAALKRTPIFDRDWYLWNNPDCHEKNIDPVEHFIKYGFQLGADPGPLFNCSFYLEKYPDVARSGINPLVHYIRFGASEGRMTNWYFDSRWYKDEYGLFIEDGQNPLEHYITSGWSGEFSPSIHFSNEWYIQKYNYSDPLYKTPLSHYLWSGAAQGTSRNNIVHGTIKNSIEVQKLAGYSFFRQCGFDWDKEGSLESAEKGVKIINSLSNKYVINPDSDEIPLVSIVVPVYGQTNYTLNAIHSLFKHNTNNLFEIVVIDDNSPAESHAEVLSKIDFVRYIRNTTNHGFLKTCNSSTRYTQGEILIFLNSDTRVFPGWLDNLVTTFHEFRNVGVVGSQLINNDETLQEAGGIVWSDGSAWNYGRNGDVIDPKYSFARESDYVSGASLAVNRAVWDQLGGFSEEFAPAYYEDTDFCFKARKSGFSVIYQPSSRVLHYEGKTHGTDEAKKGKNSQLINQRKFFKKWKSVLKNHKPNGNDADIEASRYIKRSVVVIDAETPARDMDSGSVITYEIIKLLRELGWNVTFAASNYLYLNKYTEDLQKTGVKCLYAPFNKNIYEITKEIQNSDYVLVFRVNTLDPIIDKIREWNPKVRVIYHTVDLHHLRESRASERLNLPHLKIQSEYTRIKELNLCLNSDCTIVHTEVEKRIIQKDLHECGKTASIETFPYICKTHASDTNPSERKNISFLGGYNHPPNVDAVEYIYSELWPELLTHLPEDSEMIIAGAAAPQKILELKMSRMKVLGYVDSLPAFFASSKVFIAPLWYGAGIKGKVVQAMAHGVPCVLTSVAAEGMELTHGLNALIADNTIDFIDHVRNIYNDADLWDNISTQGLLHVQNNYSWDAALKTMNRIMKSADETWIRRFRERFIISFTEK